MAVLLKTDAVFLHIPKTGGMWVRKVLEDLDLVQCRFSSKHADMERVLHCAKHYPGRYLQAVAKAGPLWQHRVRRAFKFCFIRHPLAWYESYWAYMCGRGWNQWGKNSLGLSRWHPTAELDDLGAPDFDRFVRNVMDKSPGYVSRMYGWYATPEIDFVGRQECLADDLVKVLRRLDVVFDESRVRALAPVNTSDRSSSRPVWDENLRREVEKLEAQALNRFGYSNGVAASR